MKNKIDIIISVFENASLLKMTIYSINKNGKNNINKVYIVDESNDDIINNCIDNLCSKYGNIIKIESNFKNIDYKKVIEKCTSEYIAIMNNGCIISPNNFNILINHINRNKVNFISPLSNIFFDIPENFSYNQLDNILKKELDGITEKIDNIISEFVLTKREFLIDREIEVEENGLKIIPQSGDISCIALDTYSFFGIKSERCKTKDLKNKINKKITSTINFKKMKPKYNFVTYLISIVQDSGGVHVAIDMVNYLIINGLNCNILYNNYYKYEEIMLFKPIHLNNLEKCEINSIVSTIYFSTFYAKEIADSLNIPLIYFAQGYEPYFKNGIEYATAELSYKIADEVLCVSNYLKKCYKDNFGIDSTCILNGINLDLLYNNNTTINKIKNITLSLRGSDLKGDFILMDVVKKIYNNFNDLSINIICNNPHIQLPFNNNETIKVKRINGPLKREEVTAILKNTDIYIDGSFTEGFGLMSLEAMASGAVVIASNAGGNLEYFEDGKNGLIVEKVNQAEEYISKIKLLLKDEKLYNKLKINSLLTSKKYDIDITIENYIEYFKNIKDKKNIHMSEYEKSIYNKVLETYFKVYKKNSAKNKAKKILPKKLKRIIKRTINKLYSLVNYE